MASYDVASSMWQALVLGSHRSITFKGEFDPLRGWLRDNA
jgi:hypothetical protein